MGDERYPLQEQRSKELSETKVSERHAKIWATIADTYGNRWNKSYGPLPPKVWCQMFTSLNDSQIQKAILKLVEHYPHHPPTLGEFVEMARLGISREPVLRDAPEPDFSQWYKGANKVLFRIVKEPGGVSDYVLDKLLSEKRRLVEQFEVMAADEETDVDWAEFINTVDKRLRVVLKKAKAA